MAYVDIKDLTIDKEFEELLSVLAPEELEKLETVFCNMECQTL